MNRKRLIAAASALALATSPVVALGAEEGVNPVNQDSMAKTGTGAVADLAQARQTALGGVGVGAILGGVGAAAALGIGLGFALSGGGGGGDGDGDGDGDDDSTAGTTTPATGE